MDQKFIEEKITEITFGPVDQKWSFFYECFIKTISEIEVIVPPPLAGTFQTK